MLVARFLGPKLKLSSRLAQADLAAEQPAGCSELWKSPERRSLDKSG